MTDWGGPIGLYFALAHPDRVKRLVISNTWCWPVSRDRHFVMFSFMMSNWVGRFLIKRFNIFVNKVMPRATGRKEVLTPQVMDHYRNAQPALNARSASAALPGAILGATGWLGSIWDERETFAALPSLILWGSKDIAFRKKELERWQSALSNYELHEFEDSGHFIAEESPDKALSALYAFMTKT